LADAVHAVTLVKAAGSASADPAASEAERGRAADLAERLSMPALARAWQMLLKGHDEVRESPRPLAAADMVLVRLAYAASLPPPGELARRLTEGEGARVSETSASQTASRKPEPEPAARLSAELPAQGPRRDAEAGEQDAREAPLPELKSFEDVVALAEAKRDLKLKHALAEQVRLVRFKPGTLELNPLPQAPRELGQDLMRKLKAWTGRVWIVAVSDEEGAVPLGVQRREREAQEIERVREHPAVKQVMQHFPGARIAAVRPTEPAPQDEEAGAPEALKEDGTN
jgi:DNA polymerase-3 subunit gamma/tau